MSRRTSLRPPCRPGPTRSATEVVDLLARRFAITDARTAHRVIDALADRYNIPVVTWNDADIDCRLAAHDDGQPARRITNAEMTRIRATAAWSNLPEATDIASTDVATDLLDAAIRAAGLLCAHCDGPVYEPPERSLGHCRPCRSMVTAAEVTARGCPAKGLAFHHTRDVSDLQLSPTVLLGSTRRCRHCHLRLRFGPDPTCPTCAPIPTADAVAHCSCHTWRRAPETAPNTLGSTLD